MNTNTTANRNMMLRHIGMGVLTLLGVVSLCGLLLWALVHRYDPPNSWRNPPLYPAAQHVSVQDFGERGKRDPERDNIYVMKLVGFSVADKAEDVQAFYIDARTRKGPWELATGLWRARTLLTADRLTLTWTDSARSPSVYYIDVITTPSASGGTEVEVEISMFPGY